MSFRQQGLRGSWLVRGKVLKVISLFTGAAAAIAVDTISGQDEGGPGSSEGWG